MNNNGNLNQIRYVNQCNLLGINAVSHIVEALGENKESTAVTVVSGRLIDDKQMICMSHALFGKQSKISEVYLKNQLLSIAGAVELANALQDNSALKILDLSGNNVRSEGCIVIASAISKNSQIPLSVLRLAANNITDQAVSGLVSLLVRNNNNNNNSNNNNSNNNNRIFAELDLHNNSFKSSSVSALIKATSQSQMLQKLDLSYCRCGDDGAAALSSFIPSLRNLYELLFAGNDVGDNGASLIAESLKSSPSLLRLNLRDNRIGNKGALTLIYSLIVNNVLLCLEIGRNFNITEELWSEAFASLKMAGKIKSLDMEGVTTSINFPSSLLGTLELCSTIEELICDVPKDGRKVLLACLTSRYPNAEVTSVGENANEKHPDADNDDDNSREGNTVRIFRPLLKIHDDDEDEDEDEKYLKEAYEIISNSNNNSNNNNHDNNNFNLLDVGEEELYNLGLSQSYLNQFDINVNSTSNHHDEKKNDDLNDIISKIVKSSVDEAMKDMEKRLQNEISQRKLLESKFSELSKRLGNVENRIRSQPKYQNPPISPTSPSSSSSYSSPFSATSASPSSSSSTSPTTTNVAMNTSRRLAAVELTVERLKRRIENVEVTVQKEQEISLLALEALQQQQQQQQQQQ